MSYTCPCILIFTFICLCRCILKMDHHCRIFLAVFHLFLYVPKTSLAWEEMAVFFNISVPAWLNNCVGHFNHRYFFSYCLFMTLGCVYCSISGRNLFLDAYNTLEVRFSETECNPVQHHLLLLEAASGVCSILCFPIACWVIVCLGLSFSN